MSNQVTSAEVDAGAPALCMHRCFDSVVERGAGGLMPAGNPLSDTA